MKHVPPSWLWVFAACLAVELATVLAGLKLLDMIR